MKEIQKFDHQRTAILDIGSGMGDFLKVATAYYPRCVGLEVAENMATFTAEKLGLTVHSGLFPEIEFEGKFSCIHMSHVIEHVPNPRAWLLKVKTLLTGDGILAMSVPNIHSLDRRFKLGLKRLGLFRGDWKEDWRTPDHLFEPGITSTLQFFKACGFEVMSYYTYSRKDMNANSLFGRIYNRWLKMGSNLRFFVKPVAE